MYIFIHITYIIINVLSCHYFLYSDGLNTDQIALHLLDFEVHISHGFCVRKIESLRVLFESFLGAF